MSDQDECEQWAIELEATGNPKVDANIIRRLKAERDDARNKTLDEAKVAPIKALPKIPCSCGEIVEETILALKSKEPKL